MAARDISFASFNLYNLHLPGHRIYNGDGWSDQAYQRKLQWSATTLDRLDVDVCGFQELWAKEALDDVLKTAGLQDVYAMLVPPDHNDNNIVCAAVVRQNILVGDPEWITEFPEQCVLNSDGDDPQTPDISVNLSGFSRPVLHFTVQPRDDVPLIHVFVCHVKSRRPTQVWRNEWYDRDIHGPHATALGYTLSTIRRSAEAAALRVLITHKAQGPNTPIVVIGDMNDGKNSNTLNILTEQPTYLSPLAVGGGDRALYTAQTLQEYRSTKDVYYTHVYQSQRESLDHILFSEEFYDHSSDRLWAFDEMLVANDHLNYKDHKVSGTGDHGVIRAGFRWKPARTAGV